MNLLIFVACEDSLPPQQLGIANVDRSQFEEVEDILLSPTSKILQPA